MKKYPLKAFSLIEISVVIVIIGILIAGISSGIDLYQEYRSTVARSLTTNSPLIRINDLAIWIDASSVESYQTLPKDGVKINLLKDIKTSRDKINFTQSVVSKQPIYRNSLINGVGGIEFDGIDDYMTSENSVLSQNISQLGQITIFMVTNILTSSGTGVFFKFETGLSRVGFEINNGKIRFDFPTGAFNAITNNVLSNKNLIIMATSDKINQKLFINNQLATSLTNSNGLSSNLSSPLLLGIHSDYTSLLTKFNLGELIIYDRALNDREINLITAYLSKKWGIKI